jgi:hypothetical protein
LRYWSSKTGHGGGDSNGCSHLSDGGGDHGRLTVYDCVESVDGVSGVLDGTTGAVWLHQAVAALDDVSISSLLLSLRVSCQSVLDVVRVAVLGVGVVVGVDSSNLSNSGGGIGDGGSSYSGGGVSNGGSNCTREMGSWGHDSRCADDTGPGDGHDGGKKEELKAKKRLDIVTTRRGRKSEAVPLTRSHWKVIIMLKT